MRFQFLSLLVADHQHLALLLDVDVVDEATLHHLHLINLDMVGIDTSNLTTQILLSVADEARSEILGAHLVDNCLELLVSNVDVALAQVDPASLLHALIGH